MEVLGMILGFITLWVAIAGLVMYLLHRHTRLGSKGGGTCCQEVPCSEECARRLQTRWNDVVGALDDVVGRARSIDGGPGAEWAPRGGAGS